VRSWGICHEPSDTSTTIFGDDDATGVCRWLAAVAQLPDCGVSRGEIVGKHPAAKLSENTFAVFEDAFGEEDPVVMRAASRAAVNELRFFPSVYELRRIVAREAERHEAAQYRVPD